MPRAARERSNTGIYHIIFRGINRQNIFQDDIDKEKMLKTIKHYKAVSNYEIYSYCLMDNH
ncbi:MAG: transposase, partial [Peptococcaceae bacterium BICA1-8]